MSEETPDDNTVNEPSEGYGRPSARKVRVFTSFDEQEREMIEYWASITPLQRLAHLYEMVKVSFRISDSEAQKQRPFRKITIFKQ